MFTKNRLPLIIGLILTLFLLIGIFTLSRPQKTTAIPSDYSIISQADFNQPEFYPLQQTIDSSLYQTNGDWLGRLILPTPEEIASQFAGQDGAWIEIYNAPNKGLIGQKIPLTWDKNSENANYINIVTTDVKFDAAAQQSLKKGNVNPTRLNGRSQVGPLQSLAGARPNDDVIVRLEGVNLSSNQGKTLLTINKPPIMVTGRFTGLVAILGPSPEGSIPDVCPSVSPCTSEYFEVVHYNPKTKLFDGKEEIIRIPQQPASPGGRFYSTPYRLESSDVGNAGWYIYGAKDNKGIFTVQALKPRSLLQASPQRMLSGELQTSDYIQQKNWENTPKQKGRGQTVLLDPDNTFSEWQLGDKALLIHLFGGIGGKKAEKVTLGTVTGHFSYGIAEVVKDPFTNELQFKIIYEQIYAHNPAGIISGSHSWENYMGNLAMGWVFSRPVSDVAIKLDLLEDYNFDGIILSPLRELLLQLKIMAARYRTGDGTGNSGVTPATSCVQDSNQALYIAIETSKRKVQENPKILKWLEDNPNNSQTTRFKQLVELSQRLEKELTPKNVVRTDWKDNALFLSGITPHEGYGFIRQDTLRNALLSWRSVLPRVSHDQMSQIFLDSGAKTQFIRTNQIGGTDTTIKPLAPTSLFGDTPVISPAARRLVMGSLKVPTGKDWGISLGILGIYALIALPIGFLSKFLKFSADSIKFPQFFWRSLALFFMPALVEEAIIRVAWLPYPTLGVDWEMWNAWAVLGVVIFMLYHPLNAVTLYKRGYPTFLKPVFLVLTGLLGTACTIAYAFTASLWTITVIHWIVVVTWLFFLGGEDKLSQIHNFPVSSRKIKHQLKKRQRARV